MFLRLSSLLAGVCFIAFSLNASNSDSLREVWNNSDLPDSSRLKAMHQIAWTMVFSNPDSAYFYAKKQLNFADSVSHKKQKADALNTIGVAHYFRGNFEEAEKAYQLSYDIRKELGNKKGMCSSLNNLGVLYKDKRDFEKALNYYKRSIVLWKELGEESGLVHPYGNMGIIYLDKGEPDKALEYFQKSLDILEKNENKQGMAQVISNMALVYNNKGNIKKALEYHHQSLELEEEIGNKQGMASSYGNIGAIYDEQGDTENGLKYFKKALKLFEETGNKVGVAESKNNIANIFERKGWLQQSLDYNAEALEMYREVGDKKGMAQVYNSMGYLQTKMGNSNQAMVYHEKALDLFKSSGIKKGTVVSYNYLGNIHLNQKSYDIALEYGKRGYELAVELGFPQQLRNSSRLLSRVYRKKEIWKKALEFQDRYIEMRDSINNEKTRKSALRQQLEYEYEKRAAADSIKNAEKTKVKDARLAQQMAQLEQEKTQRIALYSGLGLVLFFSLFLFNRFRVTRKQKRIIEGQKKEVEEKNNMMMDSIRYAQRIQDALLKSEEHISKHLPPHFIFYKPKDIVSGDFYWSMEKENFLYLAVADCTGHGVPGAFLTMLGTSYLNEINTHEELLTPAEILEQLRKKFIRELSQTDTSGSRDGMDISLVRINLKTREAEWAGANNPIWIIRNGENKIEEIKGDKQPIGYYQSLKPFTDKKLKFQKGDQAFLFSDGYADQFGGPKGKKFKYNNLKDLLLSTRKMDMDTKKKNLSKSFYNWKGDLEQVDDICIIGLHL